MLICCYYETKIIDNQQVVQKQVDFQNIQCTYIILTTMSNNHTPFPEGHSLHDQSVDFTVIWCGHHQLRTLQAYNDTDHMLGPQ